MCFLTGAGVWSHDDDAVFCSSELAASFGDEVLLCTRQTCSENWPSNTRAAGLLIWNYWAFLMISHYETRSCVAVISERPLTREPVHDGTFVCLSLRRQEHSKLHFTFQLSAAKSRYEHNLYLFYSYSITCTHINDLCAGGLNPTSLSPVVFKNLLEATGTLVGRNLCERHVWSVKRGKTTTILLLIIIIIYSFTDHCGFCTVPQFNRAEQIINSLIKLSITAQTEH